MSRSFETESGVAAGDDDGLAVDLGGWVGCSYVELGVEEGFEEVERHFFFSIILVGWIG